MTAPTLRTERALLRAASAGTLAAIDEVGRGALAGPVAVGVVVIDLDSPSAPRGVRDSKACPEPERRALVPRIRRWARSSAVGFASSQEIDERGIIRALALAATRALNAIGEPSVVLLDGNHDWLRRSCRSLPVVTRISGDATCASVAAASILAKVARDDLMARLAEDFPAYRWESNRGYAAPEHVAALERFGPSPLHRLSWRLPGASTA
ncbi:MAG: ribonuclease HII [Candidatus Nanopelagicales bacterium]